MRRAEMRVFGGGVPSNVAGRGPHRASVLFVYTQCQSVGGRFRRAQRPFGLQNRSKNTGAPHNSRSAGEKIKFDDVSCGCEEKPAAGGTQVVPRGLLSAQGPHGG